MDPISGTSIQPAVSSVGEPKHSKKMWIILGLIILIVAGGYFGYQKFNLSGRSNGSAISEPKFDTSATEVIGDSIYYLNDLDTLVYQKSDGKIYGDMIGIGKSSYPMLDAKGGHLVSLSSDGHYGILYYSEESVDVKDSQNNFFLVNFSRDNEMFSLGSNLSHFVWGDQNVYFMRNGLELLTYDFNLAENGPKNGIFDSPYYKITDFSYYPLDIEVDPAKKLLYVLSAPDNQKTYVLATLDLGAKTFAKILDTDAVALGFSPSGQYLSLIGADQITILKTDDKSVAATTDDATMLSGEIAWSEDEKTIHYFDTISGDAEAIAEDDDSLEGATKDVHDLIRLDWETGVKDTLIGGAENNLLGDLVFRLNATREKLFIYSSLSGKIYQAEVGQ